MKQPTTTPNEFPDMEQTRIHILTAGRELLYAAKGALQFCSKYVEGSSKSSPHLAAFFKKAITVADDLSEGLKDVNAIKKAAGAAVKPIFTVMENEMAAEKRKTARKTAPSCGRKRRSAQRRTKA